MTAAAAARNPRELRAIASPDLPVPSTAFAIGVTAADYALLAAGAATAILAPWWILKLAGTIGAGVAVAMLFALAHDAAHGSLAASKRTNRALATLCFLPSWYPYTPWIRGHNHLHHGWTNVAESDYSWRPVSLGAYRAMPAWRRMVERIYRSWWGLWIHSIVEIWWKHMAMPRADDRRYLDGRWLNVDRVLVCAYLFAVVTCCCVAAPSWSTGLGGPRVSGPTAVVLTVVLPWVIFHAMFSVVTFLHHTHPRVPWFRTKRESTFYAGQVQATVHVELPVWIELLLHNITVHGAHHVDPRVPFRHLPGAQRRLEASLAHDIIVERWSLRSFIGVSTRCKLYDYDRQCWLDFAGRPTTAALRTRTL